MLDTSKFRIDDLMMSGLSNCSGTSAMGFTGTGGGGAGYPFLRATGNWGWTLNPSNQSFFRDKSIQQRFATLDILAEQPVYLLCRSGVRSVFAALSLKQMGFEDVYSVEGGFLAWQAAGYEISALS